MGQLDDLEKHVNELISELSGIIRGLQSDIADAKKSVSFNQVKEIETSIARMKKQGIPVPSQLKELKIELLSEHDCGQACIALHRRIQERIGGLLNHEASHEPGRTRIEHHNLGGSSHRKPPIYEKPLGTKGYSNLKDYLIPVIRLMWSGMGPKAAFRKIAQKLDVRYNTVSAQCTRVLDLATDEFIRQVNSKSIVDLLERKYPDEYQRIKTELKA
jgi:hypothetical protein